MIRSSLIIFGIVISTGALFPAMQSSPAKNQTDDSPDVAFSVFQGKVDGHPIIAMIDMGLRDFPGKQRFPFFLSLSTPLIGPTSKGLPARDDVDSLNTWEDVVEARLRMACNFVFVGRMTWNGRRELLYYINSRQPPAEALKVLSEAHSTRPFTFACERDEKWEKANFWLKRNRPSH